MKYVANPVEVDAFVIKAVGSQDAFGNRPIILKDREGLYVATADMLARMNPVPGDYWVIQSDGYIYLNPKDVFERKYRPIPDGNEEQKNV